MSEGPPPEPPKEAPKPETGANTPSSQVGNENRISFLRRTLDKVTGRGQKPPEQKEQGPWETRTIPINELKLEDVAKAMPGWKDQHHNLGMQLKRKMGSSEWTFYLSNNNGDDSFLTLEPGPTHETRSEDTYTASFAPGFVDLTSRGIKTVKISERGSESNIAFKGDNFTYAIEEHGMFHTLIMENESGTDIQLEFLFPR